jgi:hypothetical protein
MKVIIPVLLICACIVLIVFLHCTQRQEGFQAQIPRHVWLTWHTKDLPPKMQQNVDKLIAGNPELTFHIYDDVECRKFIETHFEAAVVKAYDALIPTAYKADLWRYCVLYVNGGIYMDIKMECLNGFKLVELCDGPHFVKDRLGDDILNGLIVAEPQNPIFRQCIDGIIHNIKTNYKGPNPLHPTGPGLLGKHVPKDSNKDLSFKDDLCIYWRDRPILKTCYKEYREEQKQYQRTAYYGDLWHKGTIYA